MTTTTQDGKPVTTANEGIKLAAIALDLEHKAGGQGQSAVLAREVLSEVSGSDTITGVFGALGRRVMAREDHARTLELYRAGDQDIDIGFWNLDWMQNHPGKEADAALGMIDINPDLWCLSHAPGSIIEALVRELGNQLGEDVTTLRIGRDPGLVVIYRERFVNLAERAWPAPVAAALERASQGNEAAVFAATPARLVLRHPTKDQVLAHIACAMPASEHRDPDRQMRLAERLLSRAIRDTTSSETLLTDWIASSPISLPPNQRDAGGLRANWLERYSLRDVARGNVVTFLRGPGSFVRRIWTTRDIAFVPEAAPFVERVEPRTVGKFFSELAHSRPAVIRLSLNDSSRTDLENALDGQADQFFTEGATVPPSQQTGIPFFDGNRSLLTRIAADTGVSLLELVPLLLLDGVFVAGSANAQAKHANGACGFIALPDNVADWIGPRAPDWNAPMLLEHNLTAYAQFLHALKTKAAHMASDRTYYRDFFHDPTTPSAPLLLGIIDGIFLPELASLADALVEAYGNGGDVAAILTNQMPVSALAYHIDRLERLRKIELRCAVAINQKQDS